MSGLDIDARLRVTARDAAAGVRREVRIMRIVRCSPCLAAKRPRCSDCNDGLTTREERLTVKVPAGIASGTRLRLAGKGHESMLAATGDAFLTVDVQDPSKSQAATPAKPALQGQGAEPPAPHDEEPPVLAHPAPPRSRVVVLSCLAGLAVLGLAVFAVASSSRADLGQPCVRNADCRSQQCLHLDDGAVCSDACASNGDCPSGMLCGRADQPHPFVCVR